MLTDEELTTRLSAAFQDTVPELTYAGPVPQVRRGGSGLVATSALAAVAAVILAPSALERDTARSPDALRNPGATTGPSPSRHRVVRTLDLGGIHLSFATTGADPGPLYAVLGADMRVPDDAEKVEIGTPGEYWFAKNPASGEPQVYIGHRLCPDTTAGCDGRPPKLEIYGILAPGWTRDQLMQLLEHPVSTERNLHR
jgi:hypothetical protein